MEVDLVKYAFAISHVRGDYLRGRAFRRLAGTPIRLLVTCFVVSVVREPFLSRHSQASIVAGMLEKGEELILESLMPSAGVIFSDGMESDFLDFNSGLFARIHAADQKAHLVLG